MTDQRNDKPGVETVSAEEVEGHFHAIEEEPPAEGSAEEVQGHFHAIEEEPPAEGSAEEVHGHFH